MAQCKWPGVDPRAFLGRGDLVDFIFARQVELDHNRRMYYERNENRQ